MNAAPESSQVATSGEAPAAQGARWDPEDQTVTPDESRTHLAAARAVAAALLDQAPGADAGGVADDLAGFVAAYNADLEGLRSAIATIISGLGHPACPTDLLTQAFDQRLPLDRHSMDIARTAAVANPSAPPDLLARASRDDDYIIRATAARHPSADRESVKVLAGDIDSLVRRHVERRHDLDDDIRTILALADAAGSGDM